MKRIKEIFKVMIKGMSVAALRFPLTVLSLLAAASLICMEIYKGGAPGLLTQKIIVTLIVSSVLGMCAQFSWERFEKLSKYRLAIHGGSLLLAIGYFLIVWPAPELTAEIGIRTAIAVFALICAVLFIPTIAKKSDLSADFNQVALVHFKSAFTSVLFSGVLSGGLAAIIAAVDILLFKVNTNAYAYMFTIVWVLFATIYYLSLLPNFNKFGEEGNVKLEKAISYPKFLEILISYIAIPLISAYTLVLVAYFIKILVTFNWPNGQVAIMVLFYSAIGLVVFVLSSSIENKFNIFYRMTFPKILIPIVVMQLVSVFIRINEYGITESRYYVVLFGIFSIIIAVILSIWPIKRNKFIAIIAAILALISIIPPIDAFTISRNSQISRVEIMLQDQGILKDQKLYPKADVPKQTKAEVTSILSYLDNRSSLKYITWLPKDFKLYENMEKTIGFPPEYNNVNPDGTQYIYLTVDNQKPMDITGFDRISTMYSGRFDKTTPDVVFNIRGIDYSLGFSRINSNESLINLKDAKGTTLISMNLYEKVKTLLDSNTASKNMIAPELMTFDSEKNGYKMRVVFQNINGTLTTGTDAGFDYSITLLVATPN
ncbi:MAG: DUF4153 domain-containing protein [Eubacteriales bacterium]